MFEFTHNHNSTFFFRVIVQVVMISMWWEVRCWPSWMIMHSIISREIKTSSLKTLVIIITISTQQS